MVDPTKPAEPVDLRIERASRETDNRHLTPTDMLELALRDIKVRDQDFEPNCGIVILLRKIDDDYTSRIYRSNLSVSETIALLDVSKQVQLMRILE